MRNNRIRDRLLKLGSLGSVGLLLQAGGCSITSGTLLNDWVSAVSTALITSFVNDLVNVSPGFTF